MAKSLSCTSHNVGREVAGSTGPVNEYGAQTAIIPFVGIIIRKDYEL
jgi:hypothetical protein